MNLLRRTTSTPPVQVHQWNLLQRSDRSRLLSPLTISCRTSVSRGVNREANISDVPVIVLSVKGEEAVKIEALDAGADDYVTKPFGMGELLARVRANLRRSPAQDSEALTILEEGNFRIDLEARGIIVRGQEVHLSPKEFDLLVHLIRHPGKVLTHRALLSAIWGGNYVEQTEYLRVFIRHLRKKIEPNPAKPRHILTEPWIGYRFDPGK
ncbi:MAG: winged helix-turn-helix domain-containing protein [Pyrinomonadaceae bacterium]